MRLIDGASAEHDRLDAEAGIERRFRAEGDGAAGALGKTLEVLHQPALGGGLERRQRAEHGLHRDLGFSCAALDAGAQSIDHFLGIHARQHAQVNEELGMTADAVRVVAGVHAAEVQRRCRHVEIDVHVALRQFPAESDDLGHHVVHRVEGVGAEGGV